MVILVFRLSRAEKWSHSLTWIINTFQYYIEFRTNLNSYYVTPKQGLELSHFKDCILFLKGSLSLTEVKDNQNDCRLKQIFCCNIIFRFQYFFCLGKILIGTKRFHFKTLNFLRFSPIWKIEMIRNLNEGYITQGPLYACLIFHELRLAY